MNKTVLMSAVTLFAAGAVRALPPSDPVGSYADYSHMEDCAVSQGKIDPTGRKLSTRVPAICRGRIFPLSRARIRTGWNSILKRYGPSGIRCRPVSLLPGY